MTPPARYPLAALGELRRRLVDEARAELARAAAETDGASRRVVEALRAHAEGAERVRVGHGRGEGGVASDVAANARWLGRLRGEERLLQAAVERARAELGLREAQLERRRAALLDAERQLRTVERHQELWEAERGRAAARAEEAELEERAVAGPRHLPT